LGGFVCVLLVLMGPELIEPSGRKAARRAWCVNNLKQIGLALRNYHDDAGHFPTAAISDARGNPLLSWRVAILPYIEQWDLYSQFHLDEPWNSQHNLTLLGKMPQMYACPSDAGAQPAMTRYQAVTGPGTLFEKGKPITVDDVTDGTGRT